MAIRVEAMAMREAMAIRFGGHGYEVGGHGY